jgi:hypothetical protein
VAAPCDASPAQLWSTFSHWNIGQHNGLCMNTTGYPYNKPGVQPGVPVLLTKCAGGIDTLWFPLPDGQIIIADNGLCLDNPGSAAAPAAKVVMEPCYGRAGEIWAEG